MLLLASKRMSAVLHSWYWIGRRQESGLKMLVAPLWYAPLLPVYVERVKCTVHKRHHPLQSLLHQDILLVSGMIVSWSSKVFPPPLMCLWMHFF